MNLSKYSMGPLETNTYVLSLGNEALIVDPSFTKNFEFETIKEVLQDKTLIGILLTHGHIDHIAGVSLVLQQFDVPVYINPTEAHFLKDPMYNLSNMIPPVLSLDIETHDLIEGFMSIGSFHFEVVNTPGHTSGSQSFIFEDECICGDFLFKGSVGRMDFPTGSQDIMLQSIALFLKRFGNRSLNLYPGHGDNTTLQQEQVHNPYIQYLQSKSI